MIERWCEECDDKLIVPGRNGAPRECPRCAVVLRLALAYIGRGRNFDGKWWAAYGDRPDVQERVFVEFGARLRSAAESIFRGFQSPRGTPVSTDEVHEVLDDRDPA